MDPPFPARPKPLIFRGIRAGDAWFMGVRLGSVLLALTACESANTAASEHSFKGKRYVIVNTTNAGMDGMGSLGLNHRETVLARDAKGQWVEVGDGDFADLITSKGRFIRRLDSTKIKTTETGGALIPNSELNNTGASDIQGD